MSTQLVDINADDELDVLVGGKCRYSAELTDEQKERKSELEE